MLNNNEYKTFLLRYRYDGAEWALELTARDYEDAKARLARLPYASIDGEHVLTVPAALGPIATLSIAIRNAVHALLTPRH